MLSPYALGYFLLSLIVTSIVIGIRWRATRRLPLPGFVLTVPGSVLTGTILLVLFSVLYWLLFPGVPSYMVSPDEVAEMNTSQLNILAETARPFQKGESHVVSVEITSAANSTISDSPTSTQARVATGATPVGTPGVAIQDAFGPNYDVFAVAQLSGSAFDIDPKEPQKQSLDQSNQVTFHWTTLPKLTGEQALIISVTGLWVPKSGGTPRERPLGELTLQPEVYEKPAPPPPFFSVSEIHPGDIITVALGSMLNAQWIWGLVQEARKKRKEKQEASSHRSAHSSPTRKHHKRHQ